MAPHFEWTTRVGQTDDAGTSRLSTKSWRQREAGFRASCPPDDRTFGALAHRETKPRRAWVRTLRPRLATSCTDSFEKPHNSSSAMGIGSPSRRRLDCSTKTGWLFWPLVQSIQLSDDFIQSFSD